MNDELRQAAAELLDAIALQRSQLEQLRRGQDDIYRGMEVILRALTSAPGDGS